MSVCVTRVIILNRILKFYHDSLIKTFRSRKQNTSHVHAHTLIEFQKKNNKSYKIVTFWQGFEKSFVVSSREFFSVWFRCSVVLTIRLFSRSVHAFMLSWHSWTATKSFFWHKIVFRKKYWNLILAWEWQPDPRITSAVRRMVDGDSSVVIQWWEISYYKG